MTYLMEKISKAYRSILEEGKTIAEIREMVGQLDNKIYLLSNQLAGFGPGLRSVEEKLDTVIAWSKQADPTGGRYYVDGPLVELRAAVEELRKLVAPSVRP